jgi:hypothetical protein
VARSLTSSGVRRSGASRILPFLEAKAANLLIGCPELIGNPAL